MHNMYKYVYNMYKYVYNMYIMDDNMVKLKLMNPVNGSMGIMGIYIYIIMVWLNSFIHPVFLGVPDHPLLVESLVVASISMFDGKKQTLRHLFGACKKGDFQSMGVTPKWMVYNGKPC